MRISTLLPKLLLLVSLVTFLFIPATAQTPPAAANADAAAKLLVEKVGDFRAQGRASLPPIASGESAPGDFGIVSASTREYVGKDGQKFFVQLIRMRSGSAAYSFLKYDIARSIPARTDVIAELGAIGVLESKHISFIKGANFVYIKGANAQSSGDAKDASLLAFARVFAETLDGEAGEHPPLVLHLPEWERVNETTAYAVTLPALKKATGEHPVLEAVSFEGGAEAVTSPYGGAGRLAIIEFTTPQYATDNDARIKQRIDALRAEGKPVPSAYRRVGNYSVFVFDAPDEAAAAQLIDAVKWEKDVRWLGESPNALKRAQRAYYEMTGSTVLNVLIVSGVSILACLGIGGLLGGAVFLHRRAQAATTQVYTDAGGMVRLNIDDITQETDPARLLGRGER
ncbi:MAG TPA: DUF6599 family protein [Pyrinomonadaceae bacterium]